MTFRVRSRRWVSISAVLALVAVVSQTASPFAREAARQSDTTVLVVYYSRSGNTERMAEAVAAGVRTVDEARVVVKTVEDVSQEDLAGADALVLGSPTYFANIAGPMKTFIDELGRRHGGDVSQLIGGAFATGGGRTGGKEHVVVSLLLAMMNYGMVVAGPVIERGQSRIGYPGASALAPAQGEEISEAELNEARLLGARVARVAQRAGRP